jgi:hypothetical protein
MKYFTKDCLGRVPASIQELNDCALCDNYTTCLSLWGIAPTPSARSVSFGDRDYKGSSLVERGGDTEG